jgi:NAD(P)-dependent dehydrogenase (short-subunit alcohol dehydrogenase family)
MRDFAGRTAVVTGAGSGIGRALALRFAAEGMRVVVADVQRDALDGTLELLEKRGAEAAGRVTDVGDESEVFALADFAYDRFEAVHVLCNNAGVFAGGVIWGRPSADLEWTLRVNLWGVMHGIRAFVPRMIAQDTEGHIVTTSSAAGLFVPAYSAAYTISKFASYAATETLAHDLAAQGTKLKVTVLCPGNVNTGLPSSSRNRPTELAAESSPDADFLEAALSETTGRGIDPALAAETVVEAIRDERFLAFTHPEYAEFLEARPAELLSGAVPPMPPTG